MGIESVLKIGGKALTQVTKKAYVKPMCEVKTVESIGLKMGQLERTSIEINPSQKIKSLQARLECVLKSPHCEMPDYMKLIPEDASQEEVITYLQKMFQESKFFSRESTCEMLYGKNFEFARMMDELSGKASESISKRKSFKDVLKQIATGYSKETTINENLDRFGSGIYRGGEADPPLAMAGLKLRFPYGTRYGDDLYKDYAERLSKNLRNRTSPYKNFKLTRSALPDEPVYCYKMIHPYPEEVVQNMGIISERYKIFQDLVKEYRKTGKLTANQKKQANDIISEIYYLMSNTCPFERGSNGINDILMRSQYSALGINMPHVKKGVGLDLEAFCMDLNEYKMKWNSFFE